MNIGYLVLATFCAAVCVAVLIQPQAPSVPKISPLLLGLLGGIVVLAVFIALPSDPRTWSLGNLVLYLAQQTLNPLRILGVLMLGGGLFYGVVWVLYLSRRR